ncbi:MAG TPA: glycosyltransferase family 4 protein [Myxococcales bacterium]|nr:glycosyltransferase family 4 protein [Myxococcales bacterium]
MRTLILAAGRFGPELRDQIAAGREPRLDVHELQAALGADVLDFSDVQASRARPVRLARAAGESAGLAALGALAAPGYDAILTTGEDIGIPLAALLLKRRRAPAHTLISHTLKPWKKRVFFHLLRVHRRIDRILCYASSEERLITQGLGIPAAKVRRISYHADVGFFRPLPELAREPDLICAAGQLLRDYDTLIEAVRGLPVRLKIAAGSPWISSELRPGGPLPPNVEWRRYDRFELRQLYARSAVAVVPIFENDYQTGISTILEMMAMGKCVIATRTRGQTDTIEDGVTGVYVPPGDRAALRNAIVRALENPEEAARIGAAARKFVEREASLELFVSRIAETVRASVAAR